MQNLTIGKRINTMNLKLSSPKCFQDWWGRGLLILHFSPATFSKSDARTLIGVCTLYLQNVDQDKCTVYGITTIYCGLTTYITYWSGMTPTLCSKGYHKAHSQHMYDLHNREGYMLW